MTRYDSPATVAIALSLVLASLSGCLGHSALHMVHEIALDLADIDQLTISYDEEDIVFLKSATDQLILREYMTADRKNYYAKVSRQGGGIHISEGGRPLFGAGFQRSVEVFLPAAYTGDLTVTATSGNIDLAAIQNHLARLRADSTSGGIVADAIDAGEVVISSTSGRIGCDSVTGNTVSLETTSGQLDLSSALCASGRFSARTTSGELTLGLVQAGEIELHTTSGNIACQRLEGLVAYRTTSGSLTVAAATGSGFYEAANSGTLDVLYNEVTGDLSLSNKNGNVNLSLPLGLQFTFEASTKNGVISTSFQESLEVKNGNARGSIGSSPSVFIHLSTHDGDIHVMQHF